MESDKKFLVQMVLKYLLEQDVFFYSEGRESVKLQGNFRKPLELNLPEVIIATLNALLGEKIFHEVGYRRYEEGKAPREHIEIAFKRKLYQDEDLLGRLEHITKEEFLEKQEELLHGAWDARFDHERVTPAISFGYVEPKLSPESWQDLIEETTGEAFYVATDKQQKTVLITQKKSSTKLRHELEKTLGIKLQEKDGGVHIPLSNLNLELYRKLAEMQASETHRRDNPHDKGKA